MIDMCMESAVRTEKGTRVGKLASQEGLSGRSQSSGKVGFNWKRSEHEPKAQAGALAHGNNFTWLC